MQFVHLFSQLFAVQISQIVSSGHLQNQGLTSEEFLAAQLLKFLAEKCMHF